jgi:hypothetical protein
VDKRLTAWGGTQTRQIAFLRRHLPDCSLGELDASRIEECLEVLRLRPDSGHGKPVSVLWARNTIKQFRHFLKWLNRNSAFRWKRPADLEPDAIRIPLRPDEKTHFARSVQVQTYTHDELRTLWQYASPFQRLVMLLALNCGFGRAEVASLELAEVFLRQRHPHERELGILTISTDSWILRVRRKSAVHGEWVLWPETTAAIEWWLRQRAAIDLATGVGALLVTRTGKRFDSPTNGGHANVQLANTWFHLCSRVRKDHPGLRRLSFNKLRKTAGNLIRAESGGEIAGVFLCHGTPVKADGLLDLYSNRPFARVFEAIGRVGENLRSLWATVSEPFPDTPSRGGPNISLGTISRIQKLKAQGFTTGFIAAKLGVSTGTVRRWANRAAAEGHPNG